MDASLKKHFVKEYAIKLRLQVVKYLVQTRSFVTNCVLKILHRGGRTHEAYRVISRHCQRNLPQRLSHFFIVFFEITFCSVTRLLKRRLKKISMEQVNLACCERCIRLRRMTQNKFNCISPCLLSRNDASKRTIAKRDSDVINS